MAGDHFALRIVRVRIDETGHHQPARYIVQRGAVRQKIDPFRCLDQHLHPPLLQDQQAVLEIFVTHRPARSGSPVKCKKLARIATSQLSLSSADGTIATTIVLLLREPGGDQRALVVGHAGEVADRHVTRLHRGGDALGMLLDLRRRFHDQAERRFGKSRLGRRGLRGRKRSARSMIAPICAC